MLQVPRVNLPRSAFNTSHGIKTTFNPGHLIPFYCDEVLPGDTFKVNTSVLIRLATPVVPTMDNLYFDAFFFFVPNRLVWNNWHKFMGEQENPGDSTDFLVPQTVLNLSNVIPPQDPRITAPWLAEYFGIPILNDVPTSTWSYNAFHSRAYNLIWNEWFRDENLQDRAVVDKDDGPDDAFDYYLRYRGKRGDYFTTCLPWPQKDAGVMIPISGNAPVTPIAGAFPQFGRNGIFSYLQASTTAANTPANLSGPNMPVNQPLTWGSPGLEVNLAANSGTINALRQAFQIQRLLERDARGGTRYTELVRAHFDVISPDARLQRPEYLGGGSVGMIHHPIPQSSATGAYAETPQGNLSAMAVASGHVGGFSKSFTEHGVILGLISARADLTYQTGMRKMWSRRTKYDFYWPAFQNLGEMAVTNKEIYAKGDASATQNNAVFGYQARWDDYRMIPSIVTRELNSKYTTPLDFWHYSEDFDTLPVLGEQFIISNPPVSRTVAVNGAPMFIMDLWNAIKCVRVMPVYSVPGLVDHF